MMNTSISFSFPSYLQVVSHYHNEPTTRTTGLPTMHQNLSYLVTRTAKFHGAAARVQRPLAIPLPNVINWWGAILHKQSTALSGTASCHSWDCTAANKLDTCQVWCGQCKHNQANVHVNPFSGECTSLDLWYWSHCDQCWGRHEQHKAMNQFTIGQLTCYNFCTTAKFLLYVKLLAFLRVLQTA